MEHDKYHPKPTIQKHDPDSLVKGKILAIISRGPGYPAPKSLWKRYTHN